MTEARISYISQGAFLASRDANETLSTVLGSCVAACLWDPVASVGGMNHFLLPNAGAEAVSSRYGINAMEMLINNLLQLGADRRRLRAKLFGGACMSRNLADIGGLNARFAQSFLSTEDIPCDAASLGGNFARRVTFHPTSGHARQLIIGTADPIPLSNPVLPKPNVVLF
jgi:chemotaxis protein CheD